MDTGRTKQHAKMSVKSVDVSASFAFGQDPAKSRCAAEVLGRDFYTDLCTVPSPRGAFTRMDSACNFWKLAEPDLGRVVSLFLCQVAPPN